MSPIGRVFIVINLALAGGFLVVSGTHLQTKHNYKSQLEAKEKASAEALAAKDTQISKLTDERNTFENAKISLEATSQQLHNAHAKVMDDNKQLQQQLASMEGDMKQLVASARSANDEMKAAFAQAKAAYDKAVADEKTRDDAVREKDTAVAENRDLKAKIASLEEGVTTRDTQIASLQGELSQSRLLVRVAETNGFLPSMAAPNLAGLVTNSNGRLCTIQITDNPGNVNIKEAIELGKWSFAIYDASGYKAEAIAERFEESSNAVLCKVMPVKGEVREGDKAATKTP